MKNKIFKRAVATAATMTACLAMAAPAAMAADSPYHVHKRVVPNDSGGYTLTLDASADKWMKQVPADVLFVNDMSGSMVQNIDSDSIPGGVTPDPSKPDYGIDLSKSRYGYVTKAMNQMVGQLAAHNASQSQNQRGQLALVKFGKYSLVYGDSTSPWGTNTAQLKADINDKKVDVDPSSSNILTSGGTSWDAGLRAAIDTLQLDEVANDGHRKVVVFTSDGEPNTVLSDNEYAGPDSSLSQNQYRSYNHYVKYDDSSAGRQKAYEKAADTMRDLIAAVPGVKVISVGMGPQSEVRRMQQIQAIAEGKAETDTPDRYYSADSEASLNQAFAAATQMVLPHPVTITDTLTDNVEFASTDQSAFKLTSNGQALPSNAYTITVDEASKTVTASIDPDYKLTDGKPVQLQFDIVASQSAKDQGQTPGFSYPDTGDPDTGATSAGKPGFYSNTTAKAVFSDDEGDFTTLTYAKPVIQVETVSRVTSLPATGSMAGVLVMSSAVAAAFIALMSAMAFKRRTSR